MLVTGAFGLVGRRPCDSCWLTAVRVVATDLDVPANRKAAAALPPETVRWADLTDPNAVGELLHAVSPASIIHLAAIIPPACYARPALARRVNVDATGYLLEAAAAMPEPPRFVQASGVATYGARNPHRISDMLTADTPLRPSDIYGTHKVEAEQLVRGSGLDWVVLRLGGVLTAEPRFDLDLDTIYFEASLPVDGRIQTVDVRDVARAFVAATTAPVVGETLLIGGDDSHRWSRATSPSRCRPRWDWSAGYPSDAKATRTATPTGSAPTGWTPHARWKPFTSNGSRGRSYSPRRPSGWDGVATRHGWFGTAGPRPAQAPLAVLPLPRSLRRPVGRHRCQMGRCQTRNDRTFRCRDRRRLGDRQSGCRCIGQRRPPGDRRGP